MNTETITKWATDLVQIEDRVFAVQTELHDHTKESRKEIKFLRTRAKRLLDLISGREHEQLPLPGADADAANEETVRVHGEGIDGESIRKLVNGTAFRDALAKVPLVTTHGRKKRLPRGLANPLRAAEALMEKAAFRPSAKARRAAPAKKRPAKKK